jgi:hypothetical protein
MVEQSSNIESVTFNFHSLRFTPIKEVESNNNTMTICRSVIGFINEEMRQGRGFVVDRNANKKGEEPRQMFMTLVSQDHTTKRFKGTLALIRSGRLPHIKPTDGYSLVPFDKTQGEIAEQTHFFIDYSRSGPVVICFEFNSNGPRISDFEFYVRKVAHERLGLAKATTVETFMNSKLTDAIENLVNVLNITVKIQPKNLDSLETQYQGYFTEMRSFSKNMKPRFLKLEAMYRLPGKSSSNKIVNTEANNMVKNLLKGFSNRQENIDTFDDFVVVYEDKKGQDQTFDLLKGKREIIKDINHSVVKSVRDWYQIIEPDFNEFMKTLSNA